MRVLFDHQLPFALAHGGLQIQIERTKAALEERGIEVEFLRWWDASQTGDLIHFFGRANPSHIEFAHAKGLKYVMSDLLTGQGSRSRHLLTLQATMEKSLRAVIPPVLLANFRWDAYQQADAVILLTEWEAEIVRILFDPPAGKLHVVPNGVEKEFFRPADHAERRCAELVCTATITPRKRVLELAEAAALARTPLRILGAPYGQDDAYYARFLAVCAQADGIIRYDGPVHDRPELARIYRNARGFVLLSTMESLSLSALEAAASGCPLLLSDLPWARGTFGDQASYCPVGRDTAGTARHLRTFYDAAPSLALPPAPCTWDAVANTLTTIYEHVLSVR